MKTLFQHPNFYISVLNRKRYSLAKKMLAVGALRGRTTFLEDELRYVDNQIRILETCKKLKVRVRMEMSPKKFIYKDRNVWTPETELFRAIFHRSLPQSLNIRIDDIDIYMYRNSSKKRTFYVLEIYGVNILIPRKRIASDISKLRPTIIEESGRTVILPEGSPIPSSFSS